MKQEIIIYMVVRNVSQKLELFTNVLIQASKISKNFFIVNHGSDDNTINIINSLTNENGIDLELINEYFEGTMDDMKGKYYKVLKEKYGKEKKYIFILDWDEVLDEKLVKEINDLDFKKDVYLLNINTYLINRVIDKNHFQPRLFETNSVEINSFSKFHNLFQIKSKNTKKLNGIIHHYSYTNIDNLFEKNRFYAKGEAIELLKNEKNIGNLKIFFKFMYEGLSLFLYTLIFHSNYKHLEGWMYSLNWIVYKFYKYLYYLELKLTKLGEK